jgi:ribose transport system permease protein
VAWLARHPQAGTFLVLVVLVVAFAAMRPAEFATIDNFRNIAVDAAGLLILSVGLTYVLVAGGLDLSIGSVLVFSGVIGVKAMTAVGGDGSATQLLVGLVACLAAGGGWGLLNGLLVIRTKVPPLIVTLGTFSAAYGLALVITNGLDLRGVPSSLVDTLGFGRLLGVPYTVLVAAAVAVVGAFFLGRTRFGLYTFAVGSSPESARRAGVRIASHTVKLYLIAGTCAGLAGYLSLARFGTTTIQGHTTDNLLAILAVVIGGTSLFGGSGTVLGTVIGVFIPAVLSNGFVIVGINPFWQQVALGVLLIAVVTADQARRRPVLRM